ncbi:MAG: hypothetical protein OEZ58_18125 [Gammaproteobacteria bacterium]|nr:hypothetical protein [Gammaproteobacteria bacterium]
MRPVKHLFYLISFALLFISPNLHAQNDVAGISQPMPVPDASYFTIRPDLRRCISPICGGWFVNKVNHKIMRCTDGSKKRQCYVATDKINIPDLSDEQVQNLRQAMYESRVLVLGIVDSTVDYGQLLISDAWIAATSSAPKGRFVNVSSNGIVCITSPCPSYDGEILNRKRTQLLAQYDLSFVGASDAQVAEAHKTIAKGESLPIAGKFVEVTGLGGTAVGIEASQFYLKVSADATPKQCAPTGCSGQICSDSEVITTCEWRPEYECYRRAQCSQQSNGDCGWVMDDELRRCLANTAVNTLLRPSNPSGISTSP